MADPVLETFGLTKFYGETAGILDLDLRVEAGEVFGFLGPNGAGKTTTIRMLLDLIRASRGSARILGLDTHTSAVEVHRHVGYVPGEVALYENLTGEEILRFSSRVRGTDDRAYTRTLAERFDCALDKKVRHLSHGNRQKIALLQAMAHRPSLLILDEPTQGLDPLMQQRFYEAIDDARTEGRATFVSSHNLAEIEHICDRVAMVREGRLVAVEHIDALKERIAHRLQITFERPVPPEAFVGLPGVHDVVVDRNIVRCVVGGSPDAIIKAASCYTVIDVMSHEPSLEDIFLTMYGAEVPRVA